MSQFGTLLRYYRRQSHDPERGGALTQERLAELLGSELGVITYSGAAVSDWERGASQIDKDQRLVLVCLLKILCACGGLLTLEQANGLLWAGNYRPLDEDERQQVFPPGLVPAVATRVKTGENEQERARRERESGQLVSPGGLVWPPSLPDERYYPVPGREQLLGQLVAALGDPQGPLVVAVDGLGGLGKTALACELARRAIHAGLFTRLIGDSAKQEALVGEEIVTVREAALDLGSLLDSLAGQLGYWELITLPAEEKYTALAWLLKQQRHLILVDNLETAENANLLVQRLPGLLNGSRALLTTRKKAQHNALRTVSIEGFDQGDALYFLKAEATQRDVRQILEAPETRLVAIYAGTGGAPLAMKLVVAQAQFLDLEQILGRLRRAGSRLYPFIFRESWNRLDPAAQSLLVYVGRTVVTSAGWEELTDVGAALGLDEAALLQAVEQLAAYSLLEVAVHAGELRYHIHPLTRQFVNSDLPALWQAEGLE